MCFGDKKIYLLPSCCLKQTGMNEPNEHFFFGLLAREGEDNK